MDYIFSLNIPDSLKEYLKRSNYDENDIPNNLLKDIQDIYIVFDSLYYFNDSNFSHIVIDSLRSSESNSNYYNYLKTKCDESLIKISKDKDIDIIEQQAIIATLLNEEFDIHNLYLELVKSINDYDNTENKCYLYYSHRLVGMLGVLTQLQSSDKYFKLFLEIVTLLYKKN